MFTTMEALSRIWRELPSSTVKNCWNHTGLCADAGILLAPCTEALVDHQNLHNIVTQLMPGRYRVFIEDLTNLACEDNCVERIIEEDLVNLVCERMDVADKEVCAPDGEQSLALSAFEKQLSVSALCKMLCDSCTFPFSRCALLLLLQRTIGLFLSHTTKQTIV